MMLFVGASFLLATVLVFALHAIALRKAMRETEELYAITWFMNEDTDLSEQA